MGSNFATRPNSTNYGQESNSAVTATCNATFNYTNVYTSIPDTHATDTDTTTFGQTQLQLTSGNKERKK